MDHGTFASERVEWPDVVAAEAPPLRLQGCRELSGATWAPTRSRVIATNWDLLPRVGSTTHV